MHIPTLSYGTNRLSGVNSPISRGLLSSAQRRSAIPGLGGGLGGGMGMLLGPESGDIPDFDPPEYFCSPCDDEGWQQCGLQGGPLSQKACTTCSHECLLDLTTFLPGETLDPASLRFREECIRGGQTFTKACSRCTPASRIDFPWPMSDRCIQVCCTGFDPGSCTVDVRKC